ncbi:MAG: CpsD/CapB family tyrosine-protein kinase [Myxococcota bacterium]
MGEISEALFRARQEEGESVQPPASEGRAPRRHAPLYDAPGTPEARDSGVPRHEIGSLKEAASPVAPSPEPPAASPSTEARYVSIPDDREIGWTYRVGSVEPDGADAVRFRHFAVRMRAVLDGARFPSVLVTSAIQGEGKTTVAINTALALASVAPEARIALVDLDLRRGRVARELGSMGPVGVDDVLAGRADLEEIVVHSSVGRLDLLPCARTNPNAHSLFGDKAEGFFRQLHARYDYVICDGPPVLPVPDSPLISKHVGGCLAVVASGRTRHAAFRDLTELIDRDSWFGVFMNESTSVATKDRYGYRSNYTADEEMSEAYAAESEPADGEEAR